MTSRPPAGPPARLPAVAALLVVACHTPSPTITLRVMNWAADLELTTEQHIADQWAAEHTGVRVVVESISSNYGEKLVTAIASGAPPDVFLLDGPDIPAFVDRGLALDLAPYAARVGYDPASLFPEVRAMFERGAQLYAFPKGFTPFVVFYNSRLFDSLDVPLPPDTGWTWEGFLSTAQRLTRDVDGDGRPDIYALNFPRQLYEWVPFVWSAGGDILSPDGSHTEGYLDGEPAVETFTFLTALVTKYHVAPPIQFLRAGDPMRVARFYLGKQGMLVSGHWQLPRLTEYAARGGLEIGIAPIPRRDGAREETAIYASGWAVPVNVKHKRLAVQLAAYLGGPDAQLVRAESHLELPALQAMAERMAAQDTTGVERAFLALVPTGRAPWGAVVRDFHEIEEMSVDIMDKVLLQGEAPRAAATTVAREIDRMRNR
jgi:multiple sugar transport system substrate-binding protein